MLEVVYRNLNFTLEKIFLNSGTAVIEASPARTRRKSDERVERKDVLAGKEKKAKEATSPGVSD